MENGKDRIIVVAFLILVIIIVSSFLFKSYTARDESWNYQQLSLFSHNESNFSFTYSGDERNDEGKFKRMIEHINTNYPYILFNINGGDMRSDALQLEGFLDEYLSPSTVTQFNKPVMFLIGNHELTNDPNGYIYGSLFGTPTYYNFTENNSYFIVIDNAGGYLNETQMQWLKDQLVQSQKYKYRFVFMHKPLYTPNNGGDEHSMNTEGPGGADALRTLFDSSNVTMIFSSHIHNYYNGTWGRTPFIISGGAGSPAEPNHPPYYHYIVVNVNNEEVTYSVVRY